MSKLRLLNMIFIVILVIAWIPLTTEIFGNMNPDVIIIWGIIMWVALIGACTCSIIRAIQEKRTESTSQTAQHFSWVMRPHTDRNRRH